MNSAFNARPAQGRRLALEDEGGERPGGQTGRCAARETGGYRHGAVPGDPPPPVEEAAVSAFSSPMRVHAACMPALVKPAATVRPIPLPTSVPSGVELELSVSDIV